MNEQNATDDSAALQHQVNRVVARLKAAVLGLVFGLVGGIGLFAMTAILLIEAEPGSEAFTGQNLRLLNNYFIGYDVTWGGAVIGFFWGFAAAGFVGWAIGMVYNRIIGIRTR